MSPFRIILLSLLSLAIILLFYIIAYLIPNQRAQYIHYQSNERTASISNRHKLHEARMSAISSDVESSPLNKAIRNAEETKKKNDQALIEAEEQNLIAEAIRQERAARLAQVQLDRETKQEAMKQKAMKQKAMKQESIIGYVSSYDPNWAVLIFDPSGKSDLSKGTRIAVQRNAGIIVEASIEEFDQASGLWSASVHTNSVSKNSNNIIPVVGDIVIIFPLESSPPSKSLFLPHGQGNSNQATQFITPSQESILEALPEIDIPLKPTR